MSEQAEQSKYERMWEFDQYRRYAPGEKLVPNAIRHLGAVAGESFIDFGCGTGRPAHHLAERGFKVTAIDFADNCLDKGIGDNFEFIQCCLWKLPDIHADWGFCTDVMEHIPPEYADDTLMEIARTTSKGVFFQINCTKDGCGKLIGERLHLNIMPPREWIELLGAFWRDVHAVSIQTNNLVAVCR